MELARMVHVSASAPSWGGPGGGGRCPVTRRWRFRGQDYAGDQPSGTHQRVCQRSPGHACQGPTHEAPSNRNVAVLIWRAQGVSGGERAVSASERACQLALVEVVRRELGGCVRRDADHVRAVPFPERQDALFSVNLGTERGCARLSGPGGRVSHPQVQTHLHERLHHSRIRCCRRARGCQPLRKGTRTLSGTVVVRVRTGRQTTRLHLEQQLHAVQRRRRCARDDACQATRGRHAGAVNELDQP